MWCEYRITGAVFLLFGCVLFTAGKEVIGLQELEGNTVTIHTGLTGVQSDAQQQWFYGPEKRDIRDIRIVNSQIFRAENITYNRDRFRDRLQLDRSSGSLTIRNINREDSGLYKLQIIQYDETTSEWSFRVKVYALAPKPVITNQPGNCSGNPSESCCPVCSVENGEDVSLSWYEGEERISSISGSDSSDTSLHLLLNKTFPNNHTYTCVSNNPISNQTTQLNITQYCNSSADQKLQKFKHKLLMFLSFGLAGIAVVLLVWLRKKNRKEQPVSEEKDVTYAEVKTAHKKPKESQKSIQEDNGEPVVYASVRN